MGIVVLVLHKAQWEWCQYFSVKKVEIGLF